MRTDEGLKIHHLPWWYYPWGSFQSVPFNVDAGGRMLPTFHIYMIWCQCYYYYSHLFIYFFKKALHLFSGAGCESITTGHTDSAAWRSLWHSHPPGTTPSSLNALASPGARLSLGWTGRHFILALKCCYCSWRRRLACERKKKFWKVSRKMLIRTKGEMLHKENFT